MKFKNRTQAGLLLAQKLYQLHVEKPLLLALPLGGIPVAAAIAQELNFPLGLLIVKKLGVPRQPQLAAGALCEGYKPIFNTNVLAATGLEREDFSQTIIEKNQEIQMMKKKFGLSDEPLDVAGRTVIVVDDGIATGASIRMALFALKKLKALRRILAVPVVPQSVLNYLKTKVDDVVVLQTPQELFSVGYWYDNFDAISEAQAVSIFKKFKTAHKAIKLPPPTGSSSLFRSDI